MTDNKVFSFFDRHRRRFDVALAVLWTLNVVLATVVVLSGALQPVWLAALYALVTLCFAVWSLQIVIGMRKPAADEEEEHYRELRSLGLKRLSLVFAGSVPESDGGMSIRYIRKDMRFSGYKVEYECVIPMWQSPHLRSWTAMLEAEAANGGKAQFDLKSWRPGVGRKPWPARHFRCKAHYRLAGAVHRKLVEHVADEARKNGEAQ